MTVVTPLAEVALFRWYTPEELEELTGLGHVETCPSGQVVCTQGEPAAALYVVVSGVLQVDRRVSGTEVHDVFLVGPGRVVGEASLFDGAAQVSTVTVVLDSRLFVLERTCLIDFVAESSGRVEAALAGLSETLRTSYEERFVEVGARHGLQEAMEAERHRSLAQLVAGVAHEINTPLGVINVAASVVVDELSQLPGDLGEGPAGALAGANEAAELIQRNVARANTLVRSFKSLSVHEAVDHTESVDLGALVGDVVVVYSPQARADHLEVAVLDRRPDPTRRWTGSPTQLSQILLNLLANAGRHAYPDGAGGRVEIVLQDAPCPEAVGFAVTVRDFGRGIPAGDMARVLDPFFTTARERGGTGLGLAIVNTLATEAMGGTLDIDSVPGRGTAVRVTMPCTPQVAQI
ncbi:MAG: sensor histidine kinase [Acidimicrobiales bacterium]